jgi:hypothetical protein
MPRYFIDLRDGSDFVKDEEGAIYDHVEDALDEAKASARDLVQQYMDNRRPLGLNGCNCDRCRNARTSGANRFRSPSRSYVAPENETWRHFSVGQPTHRPRQEQTTRLHRGRVMFRASLRCGIHDGEF